MKDEIGIARLRAICWALLAKIKRTPPPKKPEPWLGSFSATGRITGDIVSPAVPEHEWETSRR